MIKRFAPHRLTSVTSYSTHFRGIIIKIILFSLLLIIVSGPLLLLLKTLLLLFYHYPIFGIRFERNAVC